MEDAYFVVSRERGTKRFGELKSLTFVLQRIYTSLDCPSLNKEQVIKIKLTQEVKKVDDATNIQFEIWKKENHEDHEVIKAKPKGNEIYFADVQRRRLILY